MQCDVTVAQLVACYVLELLNEMLFMRADAIQLEIKCFKGNADVKTVLDEEFPIRGRNAY